MWKTLSIRSLAVASALSIAGCSVLGGQAAEEPEYRVVQRDGDIEIREYVGFAVAETSVDAPFDEAVGAGFRSLFNYISGANRTEVKIDMTAPVITEPKGKKIAMTAPVLAQPANESTAPTNSTLRPDVSESWRIAFVLPKGLTAATAPTPTGPEVTLRDVPPRRVASIRFSGRLRNTTAEEKRQSLIDWLAARGLSHNGDWRIAGYNPPWTIPAFRRNEVMVSLP